MPDERCDCGNSKGVGVRCSHCGARYEVREPKRVVEVQDKTGRWIGFAEAPVESKRVM